MRTKDKLLEIKALAKTIADHEWTIKNADKLKCPSNGKILPRMVFALSGTALSLCEYRPIDAVRCLTEAIYWLEIVIEVHPPVPPADVVELIRLCFAKMYEAMTDLLAEWGKKYGITGTTITRERDFLDIEPRKDNIDPEDRENIEKLSREIDVEMRGISIDEPRKDWKIENIPKIKALNASIRRALHHDVFPESGLYECAELLETASNYGKLFNGFSIDETISLTLCLEKCREIISIVLAAKEEKKNGIK